METQIQKPENNILLLLQKKKSRWLQTAGIRKHITGVTSRVLWLMTLTDNHSSQSKFMGTWCSTRISTHIPTTADDIAEGLIADVNINRNVSALNQTKCSLQRHLKRGEIQQAIRLRFSAFLLDRHCFWGVASARLPYLTPQRVMFATVDQVHVMSYILSLQHDDSAPQRGRSRHYC